jgi:hypothetical protein
LLPALLKAIGTNVQARKVINTITKINIASVRKKEKIRWNDKCKDKQAHTYTHAKGGEIKKQQLTGSHLGEGGERVLKNVREGRSPFTPKQLAT